MTTLLQRVWQDCDNIVAKPSKIVSALWHDCTLVARWRVWQDCDKTETRLTTLGHAYDKIEIMGRGVTLPFEQRSGDQLKYDMIVLVMMRLRLRLWQNCSKILTRLTQDWHKIGTRLAQDLRHAYGKIEIWIWGPPSASRKVRGGFQ